jgi:hypothetical protein
MNDDEIRELAEKITKTLCFKHKVAPAKHEKRIYTTIERILREHLGERDKEGCAACGSDGQEDR